jgi:hypothetical protein
MNNNVMNNLENSKNTLDSAITELQRIQKLYSKLDEIGNCITVVSEKKLKELDPFFVRQQFEVKEIKQ